MMKAKLTNHQDFGLVCWLEGFLFLISRIKKCGEEFEFHTFLAVKERS